MTESTESMVGKRVEAGMPVFYPILKDQEGNLYTFTEMPLPSQDEAEAVMRNEDTQEIFKSIGLRFSHVWAGVMEKDGLHLHHVRITSLGGGFACVGGPMLDRCCGCDADHAHSVSEGWAGETVH